jgi:bifunctional UDP-N-acetylglucosamine pyrophosphorylase/glucosamine-1-phosphate N-acetyltransferase
MDAIILAGGKGTRMQPLTLTTPKPLLPVAGRPILEWSLYSLRPSADRVLVVAKYLKEQVEAFMAAQTVFARWQIVEQLPEPLGTGHAVRCCAPYLEGESFLVINGDDLFGAASLSRLARVEAGVLAVERDDASAYGALLPDPVDGRLARIHEKPPAGTYPPPIRVNIGAYKLTRQIFDYAPPPSSRGEYELTDDVSYLAGQRRVEIITSDFWLPIGDLAAYEAAGRADIASAIPLT